MSEYNWSQLNLYGHVYDQSSGLQQEQKNKEYHKYFEYFKEEEEVEQINWEKEENILNEYLQEKKIQNQYTTRDLDQKIVSFVQISEQNDMQYFKIILKRDKNTYINSSFCKYNGQPLIIQKQCKRVLIQHRLLKINFKLIQLGLRYSIDPINGLLTLSSTLHNISYHLFEKYIQLNLQINSYYKKMFLYLDNDLNQIQGNLFGEDLNVLTKQLDQIFQKLGLALTYNNFIKYGQYFKYHKIQYEMNDNMAQCQKQYQDIQVIQIEQGRYGFCFFHQHSPIYYLLNNIEQITPEIQSIFMSLSKKNQYFEGYSPYLLSLYQSEDNKNQGTAITDKPTQFQNLSELIKYKEISVKFRFVILYQIAMEIWHLDTYGFQINNLKIQDIIVTNEIIKIIAINKIQKKSNEQQQINLKDFQYILEIMYNTSINQTIDNLVLGIINKIKANTQIDIQWLIILIRLIIKFIETIY